VPPHTDLLLFAAGLVASSVNAAAGGGTLLSFPALLGAGLSPLAANATSTVGLLTGYFASAAEYRREMRMLRGEVVATFVPSILGGAFGAWLLLHLGDAFFARIVPALLVVSSLLLLLQPLIARLVRKERHPHREHAWPVTSALFAIAVYSGYFGAAAGILFLAGMGLLYDRDLTEVNAIKVVTGLIANVIAALTFVVAELVHPTGALHWRAAAPLALGAIAGGFVGARVARKLPSRVLAGFSACVGLAIAAWFVFHR
jgi:uncharacterized membrane protein YfcA